jgi:hypothetical protein
MNSLNHLEAPVDPPTQAQRLALLADEPYIDQQITLSTEDNGNKVLTMSGQIILDSLRVAREPKTTPAVRNEINGLLHIVLSSQSPKRLKGDLKENANNNDLNSEDRNTLIDGYNLLCGFFERKNASGPLDLIGEVEIPKKQTKVVRPRVLPEATLDEIKRAKEYIKNIHCEFDTKNQLISDESDPMIPVEFLSAIPHCLNEILYSLRLSKPEINDREITFAIANSYFDTLNNYLLSSGKNISGQELNTLKDAQIESWLESTFPEAIGSDNIILGLAQGEVITSFMLTYSNPSMRILDMLADSYDEKKIHLTPYIARGLYCKEDPQHGLAHKVVLDSDKAKLHVILGNIIIFRKRLSPPFKKATDEQLEVGIKNRKAA